MVSDPDKYNFKVAFELMYMVTDNKILKFEFLF